MTEQPWEFDFFAAYIVPPCHGEEEDTVARRIQGSVVDLDSPVIPYFLSLFSDAHTSCTVEIGFTPVNGEQLNPIRELIRDIAFARVDDRTQPTKQLAINLALVSDNRSKAGLFVVTVGYFQNRCRVVLFKFPADDSIQATFTEEGLSIRVVESAFSRGTEFFKAAIFEDTNTETCFWDGKVEERSTKARIYEVTDLWVIKFLRSLPTLTSERGSRLLSRRLKSLIDQSDPVHQQILITSARTLSTQTGRNITMRQFAENYLPTAMASEFLALERATLIDAPFTLSANALDAQFRFETIELDTQFSITGPSAQFSNSQIFSQTSLDIDGNVEITVRGRILNRKLKMRS